MKQKKGFLVLLFFLLVSGLFFWPVFFKGWLPFPGDLLVGHYAPWNSYSFLGYAPGSVPHKAQGIDVARMMFPWRHFSVEMIKGGELPLWNPYNFAGNPHLANFQTAVFYPFNIIFLFLPFNLAWTIFILLQPLLACLFTYLFMREIKVSRIGSIFASIAFVYSLYFTVWFQWGNIGHAILWLPLALFLIEKIIKKLEVKWVLLFIFSLTSSILAGYIQVTIYLFAVVFAYFLVCGYPQISPWGMKQKEKKPTPKLRGRIHFFFRILSITKKKDKSSKIKVVLASGVGALLFSLVQLLPTWEIFQHSARGAHTLEKISELLLPWPHLITVFVSDFFGNPASRNYWYPGTYIERVTYIGVLPLFFAFLAIFYRKKEKIAFFFIGLAATILVLTLNFPPARLFYGLKIPIVSTTVPTRILYLFAFSMAVLAGFGVDFFLKNKKVKPLVFLALPFFGLYLFCWLFSFFALSLFPDSWWIDYLHISQRNLVLPTAFAFLGMTLILFSSWWKKQKIVFWGIVLITLFDLFFYFMKITPFSPQEFVYPETEIMKFLQENAGINRFWGYGIGYIESNFSTFTRTYSTDGYDPLFIRRYGELISASDDGKIKDPIPRADVALTGGYGPEALRQNPFRQRLLNLLGVKYILQKNEGLSGDWQPDYQTFPQEIYQLIWQKGKWQVYENKTVLPRAFLAYDFEVIKEDQAIVNRILSEDFDLSKTVILEEEPALPRSWIEPPKTPRRWANALLRGEGKSNVSVTKYSPNQIELTVQTEIPGLLFLSDNFYPRWQAKIDGQETKIYRANYSFRAVLVPEGKHQVVFSYQPNLNSIIRRIIFKNEKN